MTQSISYIKIGEIEHPIEVPRLNSITNEEIDTVWNNNKNYLKLSGTSFAAGSSGTVTEIGSQYYYDQANSNPPVVYNANDIVVGELKCNVGGSASNYVVLLGNNPSVSSNRIVFDDVSNPSTYTVNPGGGGAIN